MAGPAKARRDSFAAADAPVPPQSIEAEQAVIGGLLLDAAAWDNVADVVKQEDFYRPDHQQIFEAIGVLAGTGKPCDVVTVSEQLERNGKLDEAGGLAYLSSVVRDTPTAANVRSYAEIVRERSLLRQLIHAGNEIASAPFNSDGRTARELVDEAEARVFEIAEGGSRGRQGATAVRTLLPGVIDQIDEAYSNPDSLRGLPTGFTDFDKMTGGLRPGDLVIVAGRPSMGKTTLAVNMAEYAALHAREKRASVAIFSMEMPSEQVITRMLSSVGGVPLHNLRSGKISDDDWVRITSATSQLSEAKIFIDETPALSPTELRARSRRVKREHGLDLIVVDYLQLMQVPGNKENRATEISEISRGLKVLAKELMCPVIALSQLNRGVEQRENKKPVMSDLRECVTGDTLVCLTDGRRVPIADLVGSTPEVWAVDARHRMVCARSDMVWKVGRREIFNVQLASGRSIRATAKHRLFAGAGWMTVAELKAGDRLALARQVPESVEPKSWPDHWRVLLGHLVGDGSYLTHQPLRYTTASEENSNAVRAAAESFACRVNRHEGVGAWHQLVISGNGNRWAPAGVGKWLKDLGIFGGFGPRAAAVERLVARCMAISPSRAMMSDYASLLAAPELAQWAESDLFWDRVVAITPAGEADVFDLTVPGPSCWLADGIVSHNSGAIEQDADMILLIYREEVYDRQTTKKGIAEIDLVKHRNGEIGNFVLTFQGAHTRFLNYVPDSYADGVMR